ncbi:TIGR03862 family flavoprotein [Limibaculum sp. FT325]|uniref:TIGR03862 family flavoprotein n=1 Tax=Thermohalobaculum sediminis TaxID=2939436 RepID=UPI0020BE37B8|nr:TIGR03862 family flavoprotein [Limibaculum sediminis]MCL5778482.1 TIGR03862 family flavoprotein [Limibaculum sediminis]
MTPERVEAAVIGAGPAGLAAAEALLAAGRRPVVFEGRPSVARKFLMAGKSGLNLTKDEPDAAFLAAFGTAAPRLAPILAGFGPREAMGWAAGLGEPLFTGSSARVFPVAMKGSPLLRRWLGRLSGAEFRTRWRWTGWQDGALAFETPDGPRRIEAGAVVLALGGASWPRLGSDAAWVAWLAARGVRVAPFRPANMGFDVAWSDHFAGRFAGAPVKNVTLALGERRVRGEFVISRHGIEGSLVYALSSPLRDALEAGAADPRLDLAPDTSAEALAHRLAGPRGRASLANHLRKAAGIEGVRAGLLRELAPDALDRPAATAAAIKALHLPVLRPRPLAEAISSAGGIAWDELDEGLMLARLPGVFAAGEMLDWEAPTGGYLLTACLATGFHAGRAAAARLGPTAGLRGRGAAATLG